MSQKAKIIKPKKKFGWANIVNYLRCLWSNQTATQFGLNKKWYVAVIVAVISVLVSLVPITVTAGTSKGSSFLSSSYVYNYDEGFYSFLEDAKEKGYDITFKDGTSSLTGVTTDSSNTYLLYQHEIKKSDGADFVDFQVYYVDTTSLTNEYVNTLLNTISETKVNPTGTGRDASFIIFTTKSFTTRLYRPGVYSTAGGIYGDYENLSSEHTKLSDLYVSKGSTRLENVSSTLTNYKGLVDEIYINTRKTVTWTQTGIIAAVNSGIVLLMGLVVFLLTRGKNNPNRGIKFQQCFNIAYWCTATPAIIALILGFWLSQYQVMLFVMTFGFRIMWLSMKTLSPNNPPVTK